MIITQQGPGGAPALDKLINVSNYFSVGQIITKYLILYKVCVRESVILNKHLYRLKNNNLDK